MTLRFAPRHGLVVSAVVAVLACQGQISGGSGTHGTGRSGGSGSTSGAGAAGPGEVVDTDGDGKPDTPVIDPADPNAAGPMPLRRLNRREYNNTVRDLLGVTTRPGDQFSADTDGNFPFPRAGMVAILDAEHLRDAAEKIAAGIDVTAILPCKAADGEAACAKTFIEKFGLKAYRRPLVDEEVKRLVALYEKGRGELKLNFNDAIKLLVEAFLQAPGFLYRWELGPKAPKKDGAIVKLSGYEMASRLSYFLWRSMPDQNLFDAAAANKLDTDADLVAQVKRLLKEARARESIASFFDDWLKMSGEAITLRDKDTTLYPEFKPDLQAAMATETQNFVTSVIFDGDGTFQSLLTSTNTSLNGPLAALYGVKGISGAEFKPASLAGTQRSGLLTRAAFLTVTGAANGSNPVKRGKRVFQGLLCQELTPPPGVVIPPADPPSAGGTTRERFERHEENACASCHELLDPLGFAFEHYDGIGKWRDTDNGSPVNSADTLFLDGAEVAFNDGVELSAKLAASEEVRACFATQWVRYAFDRLETDYDEASIQTASKVFASGGYTIPALLEGVAMARSFRFRILADGEVSQ